MPVTPIQQRFAMLFLLAGFIGIYLVVGSDSKERVCGLPSIPAGFYAPLGVPTPTGPNGTGAGDCLLPGQAEDMFRKLRIAAAILPKWRAAGLDASHCAAALLAVEFSEGFDGGASDRHEEIVRVCGPAPSEASTQQIERLRRLPGTAVDFVEIYGIFANNSYPVLTRWTRPFPPGVTALLPCACRPLSDSVGACKQGVPGSGYQPAPFRVTLGRGTWNGSCSTKTCTEHRGMADRAGLGYSMPTECR